MKLIRNSTYRRLAIDSANLGKVSMQCAKLEEENEEKDDIIHQLREMIKRRKPKHDPVTGKFISKKAKA